MRRAYCSKECQMRDWKAVNGGQGHKNWCKLKCGEEGLDWEVVEIPSKGLGLRAISSIPCLSRIMVDGLRAMDDPVLQTLEPKDGTFAQKFELNCLGGDTYDENSYICARISRANHNCNPNAAHYLDNTAKAKVLYAERDIQPDEEICISYTNFTDCSASMTPEEARFILAIKWKIQCSPDCYCYQPDIVEAAERAKYLDEQIQIVASTSPNTTKALKLIRELLSIHEKISSSQVSRMRTFYDGFQIAIMKRDTLSAATSFIQAAYDIKSHILSPKSEEVKTMETYLENPSSHRNYLIREFQI